MAQSKHKEKKQRRSLNTELRFSPTIARNQNFLRSLARTRSLKRRKQLLRAANTEQLLCLVEIAMNVLRNRFRLTRRQRNRMLPFAEYIRRLGRVRSERGAHKLVVQKGAGLPIGLFASLLTPIITVLARSLIAKAIASSTKPTTPQISISPSTTTPP